MLGDKASHGEYFDKASPRKFAFERSRDSNFEVGRVDDALVTANTEQIMPSTVQLSHLNLVHEFRRLKQRKVIFLPQLPTLSLVQDRINAAIDALPVRAHDVEIVKEQKAFIRAIRTYNGRADQERIEKRNHEMERMLQLRQLEYQHRGKKPSAEEVEFFDFVQRPAMYALPLRTRKCRLGKSCNICANQQAYSTTQREVILHPSVKRVDASCDGECVELGTRRSRTHERSLQQELLGDALTSLQHRINFIERYNQGWIVTNKRKN